LRGIFCIADGLMNYAVAGHPARLHLRALGLISRALMFSPSFSFSIFRLPESAENVGQFPTDGTFVGRPNCDSNMTKCPPAGRDVLQPTETTVITGQRIRLRPHSRLAREWSIPDNAHGTLICSYQVLARDFAPDRVDVRFNSRLVVWGAPAAEFEPIDNVQPKSS
jgi:hypothetical protein